MEHNFILESKVNKNQSIYWVPSAFPFFLFGFTYYLITPYLAFNFMIDSSVVKIASKWMSTSYFDMLYLSDCILIIVFWLLGYFTIGKINPKVRIIDKFSYFRTAPSIIGFIFLFFLFFLVVTSLSKGSVLFSGYSSYDVGALGQLSTLVFMSVFFLNYFQRKSVYYLFLIIFFVSSVILLGFGSRMFFVLGAISLIISFISLRKHILTNPLFILSILGLLILVLGIGVWRSGDEITLDTLLFIFLAEPIFTSTSGALYIDNMGGRPVWAIPKDLFASFVNFIPTIIFPEKLNFLDKITYNENRTSPFGASALIANMYSNFGVFFPIYFFIMGLFYGFLKRMANTSIFYRAVYFSLLPMLMFHFFREGYITVFKVIFFNGFILPTIMIGGLYLLFRKKMNI